MKAITLRNLPPELARYIREEAHRKRQSLNRTVISLLEQASGIVRPKAPSRHHDLDKYFGTLSREEADILEQSVQEQRRIDPDLWT
jgi:hypothetical protein